MTSHRNPLKAPWSIALLAAGFLISSDISSPRSMGDEPPRGLHVYLGSNTLADLMREESPAIVHCLERDEEKVRHWREQFSRRGLQGQFTVELWEHAWLPHANDLVNRLVVEDGFGVPVDELERVTAPGGTIVHRVVSSSGDDEKSWTKPFLKGLGQWTHQWNDASGSITSSDTRVDVPTGVRWVQGPLFAMAGRKSSTQSLVSSGGRNFHVTQNVVENLDRAAPNGPPQWLVARDAFNGLQLWKRPWMGPAVTGDGETNARLVASADRVFLVTKTGLMTLDAASGETLWEHALPSPATKLLEDDGLLVAEMETGIHCFQDGELLWELSESAVHGTVSAADSLFLLVSGRDEEGQFRHDLVSLQRGSGEPRWRVNTQPWTRNRQLQISFADENFVGLQAHGHFHVFSSRDGRHLWSRETEARPGKDYVDERFVGHLYVGGQVWLLAANSPGTLNGQKVWLVLDPKTGEVTREVETSGSWPRTATPAKMGCQLIMANERFIMIPRQATFIETASGTKHDFKFLRGGCGLGFVPANGLIYSHPHACGCFSEVVRGFIAAHSQPAPTEEDIELGGPRWMSGPAHAPAKSLPREFSDQDDWPMHRRDAGRSASSSASVPRNPIKKWQVVVAEASRHVASDEWQLRLGSRITAPTIAGGLVYVADIQGHQVVALDMESGTARWRFTAGGRVDSPPTIFQGLCLFGSHDGYVYCVRADDGELMWRFRAAPVDRRMVAFGQLESTWPVAGSVLVQDGVAFVAAGRAPDADGGMTVSALDPADGRLLWSSTIQEDVVGLGELLVGDGKYIYLANWRFHPRDGSGKAIKASTAQHLRGGKMGLLESSWTSIDLALRKEMHDWTARGASGQLLAFRDSDVFGFHLKESGEASLFRTPSGWKRELKGKRQVHALVVAGKQLLAAGAERNDPASGFLAIHAASDGRQLSETLLAASPTLDGVAVAQGRIFVSLRSGELVCFGP